MDRKAINTTIIDDMIEKLENLKKHEKIGVASYTRFSEATEKINLILEQFDSVFLPVDLDR